MALESKNNALERLGTESTISKSSDKGLCIGKIADG